MAQKKIRLGDLLLEKNLITQQQLEDAIAVQKKEGGKLGSVIIKMNLLKENALLQTLADQLNLPYIDLKQFDIDQKLIAQLPEKTARRLSAIILQKTEKGLLVGMADPLNLYASDEISRELKQRIELALVSEAELEHCISANYRQTAQISGLAKQLSQELGPSASSDFGALSEMRSETDVPVVKLLETILADAVQMNASDIHIEPDQHVLRIRQRIDGVLQEQIMDAKQIASALTIRLKLVAGLNISEKRLPQDGRFNISIKGRSIDIRLSTLPTQYGESVVMRLLDQTTTATDLEELGLPPALLKQLNTIIRQPHGMILVTGPTGSGKTTTLYSILNALNEEEKKIITVEDPVEYRVERINQVQVNPKIELSFAKVLRATMRQDPDIIMVGEIRDEETSTIALRAAMTGHLVLATLHTNDVISSAVRLMDMGSEGYLVGSALIAVIAQRLVRRICDNCKNEYQPTEAELNWLKGNAPEEALSYNYKYGRGCSYCHKRGYAGRHATFEILEINADMMSALRENDPAKFADAANKRTNKYTIKEFTLHLAKEGITTINEVIRIVGGLETLSEPN